LCLSSSHRRLEFMRIRGLPLVVTALIACPTLVSSQTTIEKNVVIGMVSGLALLMDVHRPARPNGYAIVHISGSGWGRSLAYNAEPLSERQVDIWGAPLVDAGYTVFSLNHRAIPRFRWPDPLDDVQRAVRFIRTHAEEYGIDPDRIGAVGGSSGGTRPGPHWSRGRIVRRHLSHRLGSL
jgi:acetyl esterase/lipase